MKQTTFVAEAVAYRTIPQTCPKCGSEAKVEIDDPQEPEAFWRYSCGCSNMGCTNYVLVRRSFSIREDAIANWNGYVFLNSYAIDYKQTPKFNEQLCHTLTREGDGGIHSAVAYAEQSGCLTPWDVQSKRVFSEDSCGPTLPSGTNEGVNIQPIVMASGQANAEIGAGGGSDADGAPRGAVTSNGSDVFPSLCATDGSKQFIDNQSVTSGRLLLDPRREWV